MKCEECQKRCLCEDCGKPIEVNLMPLDRLEIRFKQTENLHGSKDWHRIKLAMLNNNNALKSLELMEEYGHEPHVYEVNENGFKIGTLSKETPEKCRNMNYHESVQQAEEWGIELMNEEDYKAIQSKVPLDNETWSWLLTRKDILSIGNALDGTRYDNGVNVNPDYAYNRYGNGAWRGSFKVKWNN